MAGEIQKAENPENRKNCAINLKRGVNKGKKLPLYIDKIRGATEQLLKAINQNKDQFDFLFKSCSVALPNFRNVQNNLPGSNAPRARSLALPPSKGGSLGHKTSSVSIQTINPVKYREQAYYSPSI